jgi:uncharacterized membrane protein YgcG
MKKIIAAMVLAVASAMAFALPAPSQIENALAAKDYRSARSMTEQVLRERPESAKAHLFNAYILAKTGDKQAAAVELSTAARLDKKGDVKSSALFGRTAGLLEASAPAQKPVQQAYKPAQTYTPAVTYKEPVAPVKQEKGWFASFISILFWLTIAGVLVFLLWKVLNPAPAPVKTYKVTDWNNPTVGTRSTDAGDSHTRTPAAYDEPRVRSASSSFSAPYTGTTSRHVHQPVVQEIHHHHNNGGNNGGSSFGSNLAATAGGVVAGNVISDMLLHRHGHSHGSSHSPSSAAAYENTPSPRYSEPEPAVDYETTRSSFASSSSRDDDWGSSRSSVTNDDWGGGSSSTSSDFSGSSDSGGGGDW